METTKATECVMGVDVGINGAISFYDGGELIIWDMPVFSRNKTKKVDNVVLKKIINEQLPNHAYIEQVNAFNMGATSAYGFGWNCGCIEAVLSCCKIPFTYVTPQVWKKAMQCPKDKDSARMRASQLMPDHAHNWDLKKHDGRAESALIALYGFNKRRT